MLALALALAILILPQQGKQDALMEIQKGLMYPDMAPSELKSASVRYVLTCEGEHNGVSVNFTATCHYQLSKEGWTANAQYSGSAKKDKTTWTYSTGPTQEVFMGVIQASPRVLFWSPKGKRGWIGLWPQMPATLHWVRKTDSDTEEGDQPMGLTVEVPDWSAVPGSLAALAVQARNAAWIAEAKKNGNLGGWTNHTFEVPVENGKSYGSIAIPMGGFESGGIGVPAAWEWAGALEAKPGAANSLARATLTIQWQIGEPPERPELEVEIDGYDDWLPQSDLDGDEKAGSKLLVKAKLKNANGKELKPDQKATRIRFELVNTSREPGIALNWPPEDPSDKPDIRFEKGDPDIDITDKDGQKAERKGQGIADAAVHLGSYDNGGFSTLRVVAETPSGEITGYLKGSPGKILIPKREESSYIASKWLKDNKATGKKDADDEEDEPVGNGVKGDGFTLYEEYRGLMEGGKHIRLNPIKKDLCLCDRTYGVSGSGIELFASLTGLSVHKDFAGDEMGKPLPGDDGIGRDRVMNHNHGKGPHAVDQHGMPLMFGKSSDSASRAMRANGSSNDAIWSPKNFKFVRLIPDLPWAEVTSGKSKTTSNEFAVTVAHEIGHTCNLRHHGETDTGTVTIKPDQGQLTIRYGQSPPVPLNRFCLDDKIGVQLLAGDTFWRDYPQGLVLSVGVDGGQHSGFEDCIMRYDIANAFWRDQTLYWNYNGELTGIQLCQSPDGTGVNAPNHDPRMRFGKATKGACAKQLCVNDKHP